MAQILSSRTNMPYDEKKAFNHLKSNTQTTISFAILSYIISGTFAGASLITELYIRFMFSDLWRYTPAADFIHQTTPITRLNKIHHSEQRSQVDENMVSNAFAKFLNRKEYLERNSKSSITRSRLI